MKGCPASNYDGDDQNEASKFLIFQTFKKQNKGSKMYLYVLSKIAHVPRKMLVAAMQELQCSYVPYRKELIRKEALHDEAGGPDCVCHQKAPTVVFEELIQGMSFREVPR